MSRLRRPRRAILATVTALTAGLGSTAAASASTSYDEPYRPQFHFSLPASWMGDPNGLVYRNGQYYLYSYGTWQGAVSSDLVHWKNIPVTGPQADPGSSAFFSGSAVVDKNNTSGFGTPGHPPMVAMYTSVSQATGNQTQSLAYSTDGGRTWTRYAGNPVLDQNSQNFRDPKVFWYEPTHSWLMAITLSDQSKVSFYRSPDLKHWTHLSDFGPAGSVSGVWEMPDLFPLPVDGKPDKTKWVLTVSVGSTGVQYFVGTFDGTTFTSDDKPYAPPTGTLIGDGGFEGSDYGDWTASGAAFGSAPAHSDSPSNGAIGTGWVDSYGTSDSDTGTLTSPTFTITHDYINFLIAGGNHPYQPDGLTSPPTGTTIEDFEGDSLPGWTGTGDFAGITPTKERLSGQVGNGVLDTCQAGCDAAEGTITSPAFTIDHRYLDLLVAGGNHPLGGNMPTAVAVLVNGNVVASVTGNNSGSMNWQTLDLSAYQGQQAQLEVIDQSDGSTGWGHLMVDNPVLSDTKATGWANQTGANLIVNGQVARSATGNSSPHLDWTNWNVKDLVGQQAQIQIVDHNNGGDWGHTIADNFEQADTPAQSANQRAHWIDYGADFYAANTWNDTPNGQRIQVAWMNNWDYASQIPTSPWQGAETFPRELSLRDVAGQIRLRQEPVQALSDLRDGSAFTVKNRTATDATTPLNVNGDTLEITARLTAGTASRFGLNVRTGSGQYTQIGYDTSTHQLYLDRTHSGTASFSASFPSVRSAPLELDHGAVTLHVLVDRSSVEVFADGGLVTLTDQIFPEGTSTGVSLFADGGSATLDQAKIWHLKSSWS